MNGIEDGKRLLKTIVSKSTVILMVAALTLFLVYVMADDKDGRKQVVSEPEAEEQVIFQGGKCNATEEEQQLAQVLSSIRGVGATVVMVRDSGVIVSAEGAHSAVVRQKITEAVCGLFGIPADRVNVYEKEMKGD